MPTLDEVEEALRHLSLVPSDERGAAWHAYLDSLLEQRKQLTPAAEILAPMFSESLR